MEVFQDFHMNGGTGDTSYSSNSFLQKKGISKTKPIIEKSILNMVSKFSTCIPKNFGIADLGCASGSNTFLVVSYIVDTIYNKFFESGRASPPEFLVFLNDLPGNDFNTIFRSLQGFYDEQKETKREEYGIDQKPCFVVGVPGTFYGRLFPSETLHFVHSSFSLHWLSQVPPEIRQSNKGNIYMAKSSPTIVLEAYLKQFHKDFKVFLRSRSEEVVGGGHMVLTILGRTSEDPSSKECCYIWELLATALRDMVAQGMIEEEKLDSFNMPQYSPSPAEMKAIIESEGSFLLNQLETFEMSWIDDTREGATKGINSSVIEGSYCVANYMRAAGESLLVSHFGEEIMDELFSRYREIIADRLSREETKHVCIVLSMTKG